MLFVGGRLDGQRMKWSEPNLYAPDWIHANTTFAATGTTEHYTRRKFYNNDRTQSFTVMALESMKGEDVIAALATKQYKDNPLYPKRKSLLFVGGPMDGRSVEEKFCGHNYYAYDIQPIPIALSRSPLEYAIGGSPQTVRYTRRRLYRNGGGSFEVMALSTLSDDEVIHKLIYYRYERNPLRLKTNH